MFSIKSKIVEPFPACYVHVFINGTKVFENATKMSQMIYILGAHAHKNYSTNCLK